MVATPSRSDLFSRAINPARVKVILLGSSESYPDYLMNRLRSLNFEHVSPSSLMRPEIWRRASESPKGLEAMLAAMRRWFWTRKPDAGFLLTEFPATLLQAQVFDEWLEARSESLTAVLAAPGANAAVVEYYRTQGLLDEGLQDSAS